MNITEARVGDTIQGEAGGDIYVIRHVFPEKIVAMRTIDIMAADLAKWQSINTYGTLTVGGGAAKAPPAGKRD